MRHVVFLCLAGCASAGNLDGGDPFPDDDGGSPNDGTTISLDGLVIGDGSSGDTGVVPMGCMGQPDGVQCDPAPDLCHTDGVCKGGVCQPPGTRADGFNWKQGDDYARCCGGKAITTNTNSNCGVCGIQCNGMNGESCMALGGRWFCRGCNTSAGCWSKCCSLSFNPPSCAASDCNGNCSAQYCPMGTVCKLGMGTSSNYCAYP
jgi:hypothetical protein